MDRNIEIFLKKAYLATQGEESIEKITELIKEIPTPSNAEEIINELSDSAWKNTVNQVENSYRNNRRLKQFFVSFLFVGLFLFGGGFLVNKFTGWTPFSLYQETPSPSAVPVEFSPTPTISPTITPFPTATMMPTPVPPSVYLVPGPGAILPAIPGLAEQAWVLDASNAIVSPALNDTTMWEEIQNATSENPEAVSYVTRTGNVSVSWQMDVPVPSGLYALYVLDTQENSNGSHAFSVLSDGVSATPYRGQGNVIFGDGQQQLADEWLSLGFYQLEAWQILAVEAQIGPLSDQLPFLLDRLLIVKIPDTQRSMIDSLPGGRVLVSLLDDDRATFKAQTNEKPLMDQGVKYTDVPTWKNEFLSLDLSGELWVPGSIGHEVWVDWEPLGKLPPGSYELYVWIPAQHATAIGEFSLLANGRLVQRDTEAPIDMSAVGGEWKSMGIWNLTEESAVGVRLAVKRAEQLEYHGEIGVDAVALVRVE
jgi:hypothetical protein